MGQGWRTVTEFVPYRDQLVSWSVEDRSTPGCPVMEQHHAWRSPLTGWWFVHLADGTVGRCETLIQARRRVLGGNGLRIGGHSEVTHVRNVPRYSARLHRIIVTGGES